MLIKGQSDAMWLLLLHHHNDPSIVVSTSAARVMALFWRIYDREQGLVRHHAVPRPERRRLRERSLDDGRSCSR